jgi:hypothetical protein
LVCRSSAIWRRCPKPARLWLGLFPTTLLR